MVGEPTEEEAVQILKGLKDRYEAHHKVTITDEAIDAAVKLSSRYIADRYLPDKAIDLIDEAASRVRLRTFTAPEDLQDLEKRIKDIEIDKLPPSMPRTLNAPRPCGIKRKNCKSSWSAPR